MCAHIAGPTRITRRRCPAWCPECGYRGTVADTGPIRLVAGRFLLAACPAPPGGTHPQEAAAIEEWECGLKRDRLSGRLPGRQEHTIKSEFSTTCRRPEISRHLYWGY